MMQPLMSCRIKLVRSCACRGYADVWLKVLEDVLIPCANSIDFNDIEAIRVLERYSF